MTVYFFIVNYFTDSDTLDLVAQIKGLPKEGVTKVVVAVFNNGSNSSEIRESSFIDFYMEGENIGLAPAWIQLERGCKPKAGDVLVFLNNDIVLPNKLLIDLVRYQELFRNSVCGPVINNLHGDCWSAGGRFEFGGIRVVHNSEFRSKLPFQTGHVSGCFMIMNKEVYNKVGEFDDRFFFRGEEWDFNLRAKKYDVPRCIIPEIVVVHKVNGSHDPASADGVRQKNVAKKLYWEKHFPTFFPILYSMLLAKTALTTLGSSKTVSNIRSIFRGL